MLPNQLLKLNICFLNRACINLYNILKARETSAFSGDMFTTKQAMALHARPSSYRNEHTAVVSPSVCRVPFETKDRVVSQANRIQIVSEVASSVTAPLQCHIYTYSLSALFIVSD